MANELHQTTGCPYGPDYGEQWTEAHKSDVNQTTIPGEDYEREMYAEVAWKAKRDRISAVVATFHNPNWEWWPGSLVIANAIMKEIG